MRKKPLKTTFITVLDMRLPVGLAPVAPTRNSQTFALGKVRFADYPHLFDGSFDEYYYWVL